MESWPRLDRIEKSIAQDKKFLYTIVSYIAILSIFLNLNTLQSPLVGLAASIIFSISNVVFLGNAMLKKEAPFLKFTLGVLLLMVLLGFAGWLIMIIYNLDIMEFTLVLVITTTFSSLLNRRMKHENASR